MRQNRKHRASNRATKTFLKTKGKKVLAGIGEGAKETAEKEYRVLVQALDRAARKRVIHPNQAARKKSRLLKRLRALESQTPKS